MITAQAKFLKQTLREVGIKASVRTDKLADGSFGSALATVTFLTDDQINAIKAKSEFIKITIRFEGQPAQFFAVRY